MPGINKSPGFHISPSHSEHILVGCDPQCRTPDERTHNNRGSGTHKTEQLTTQTPVSPVKRYLCAPVTPSYHEEENIISIEYKQALRRGLGSCSDLKGLYTLPLRLYQFDIDI